MKVKGINCIFLNAGECDGREFSLLIKYIPGNDR